jgi:tRNA-specific 2-thiouridylase
MSGGVDSSVAALVLKQEGYEVHGFSFRLAETGDAEDQGGASFESARKSAALLGIPHTVIDLRDTFRREVVQPFIRRYLEGKTPSPCIRCNRDIKFSALGRLADDKGFHRIATGHYARITFDMSEKRHLIWKAASEKDQSYFLFSLTQAQLARAVFPLGELKKSDVRKLASEYLPHVSARRDSQEICFIPDQDYGNFIAREAGGESLKKGSLVDEEGGILRTHDGIHRFTVGQRRGLGVAAGSPRYVLAIDPATGNVTIGPEEKLYRKEMAVAGINWMAIEPTHEPIDCLVKIRYNHPGGEGRVFPRGRDTAVVLFSRPQRAITPGQGAAFYDGDLLLGGGWIER